MKRDALRIDIVTLFPEACSPYLDASILGRAQKEGLIDARCLDLRPFGIGKHRKVDDVPFGGGAGMVMRPEPLHAALRALKVRKKDGSAPASAKETRVIVTSASGKRFTQADAERLSKYRRLVFLCGRYEGIDARVEEKLADESFAIGEYVLTGGELPALVMADAIARLRPGVLGAAASLAEESWSDGKGEYPQYTQPPSWLGVDVPEVLRSGHHAKIRAWRDANRSV